MKIKINMPVGILSFLLAMHFATHLVMSQDASEISHAMYHKYEGHYYFEDGSYISGGLMDEGEGGLVFIEPLDVSRGGIFLPENKTVFNSISFSDVIPAGYTQIEFDFNQDKEAVGLWWKDTGREPVYAQKKQHHTLEMVEIKNGDITLAGELYLPKTEGPHPVMINVHGSGKQTRHLGPWNTLFAKYGIAVLSYDKRGVGESTGYFGTAGYPDFASDVVAAIKFAKQHAEINPDQIGLHGSSEGGWVSSIAVSKSDDIAFLIIRAGSGVSGFETYIHEVKNELIQENLTDSEFVEAIRFERKIQEMAADGKSLAEVNAYIEETRANNVWFPKAFGDYDEMNPDYWVKIKKSGMIDPIDHLRKVSDIPVLWFLAENDENVPYELSKPRLEVAFEEAGNKDFELVTIPDAKHSFLVYTPDGKMKYTDGYWDKMISWLQEHDIATGAIKSTSIESSNYIDGIGGIFFKVNDPQKFKAWYKDHLGINAGPSGAMFFWRKPGDPESFGRTVWTPFSDDTKYFGTEEQQLMINYRVKNLEGLLKQLKASGVKQVGHIEEYWYGRFAWILDVEGNRVELWEPVDLSPEEYYRRLEEHKNNNSN